MTRVCYSFYERCMNMINVCDVGKRIKELRISSKLTQDKIAEYLSLNQSMIAKMEKGERNITSDVIAKINKIVLNQFEIDQLLETK